jgi:hypothetical protein
MGGGASTASSDPDDLKAHGNEAFKAGEFVEAILWYTKALENAPDNAVLFSNRSAAFLGNGQYAKALVDAETSAKLRPDWAKAYFRAGSALIAIGRKGDAIDWLDKARALDPKNDSVIKAIADAGKDFNPASRGTGCLLTWGAGDFGALGHGDDRAKPNARVVDAMRGKHVVDVGCGMIHTVAVTGSGETFSWGHNQQYQCGLGHAEPVMVPTLVPALLGKTCVAVACGAGHTIVIVAASRSTALVGVDTPSSNGVEVYAWGIGKQGQLGESAQHQM